MYRLRRSRATLTDPDTSLPPTNSNRSCRFLPLRENPSYHCYAVGKEKYRESLHPGSRENNGLATSLCPAAELVRMPGSPCFLLAAMFCKSIRYFFRFNEFVGIFSGCHSARSVSQLSCKSTCCHTNLSFHSIGR